MLQDPIVPVAKQILDPDEVIVPVYEISKFWISTVSLALFVIFTENREPDVLWDTGESMSVMLGRENTVLDAHDTLVYDCRNEALLDKYSTLSIFKETKSPSLQSVVSPSI